MSKQCAVCRGQLRKPSEPNSLGMCGACADSWRKRPTKHGQAIRSTIAWAAKRAWQAAALREARTRDTCAFCECSLMRGEALPRCLDCTGEEP